MTFRVGQKVVCIDARPMRGTRWDHNEAPQYGAVYTISEIWTDGWHKPVVSLAELPRYTNYYNRRLGFGIFRFRPAVERKTDISIFTAMLKTERQPFMTDNRHAG